MHVYPVQFWVDFALGKDDLEAPPIGVLRQVIREWLLCTEQHGGFDFGEFEPPPLVVP